MQLQSVTSSQDVLRPQDDEASNQYYKEERRRTGRYVAGGAALAIILVAVYHMFARGISTIAGICIPAIIMATYVVWVLYSARRDRLRAMRIASAVHLAEVNDGSNICGLTGSTAIGSQKNSLNAV